MLNLAVASSWRAVLLSSAQLKDQQGPPAKGDTYHKCHIYIAHGPVQEKLALLRTDSQSPNLN